jgi:photosystem II stability/assembly factor-like uncharacterized protein
MKRIVTVIVFFIFATLANAQWTKQTSGTTLQLVGVKFIDATHGWVVGDNGTIRFTTDGGTSWNTPTTNPAGTMALKSVSFSDASNGWVVGQSGTILHTTDGGVNWTLQSVPGPSTIDTTVLRGVFFTDANNGTAVGDFGNIIRTTDGGANWTIQTSGTTNQLFGVSFANADIGWAVGVSGTILNTTDGGTNWGSQTSANGDNLRSVCFVNANNGWAVGQSGTIITTTNGGTNWGIQNSGFVHGYFYSVWFTDTNNGTAVGDTGRIVKTSDGGANWTTQFNADTNFLYGVSFIDANTGAAVGILGTILTTTNGGLPVELASFSASEVNNSVVLSWKTETEVNNYGFDVERASANSGWQKIGFVAGSGNSNSPKNYTFTDNPSGGSSFSYRLKQIDVDGSFKYYDAVTINLSASSQPQLLQNSPNPFNPSTIIKFYIPNTSDVTIKIYDILGREVTTLINQQTTAGYHNVYWNGKNSRGEDVSSGVYLYRLTAGSFSETKKMNLLK